MRVPNAFTLVSVALATALALACRSSPGVSSSPPTPETPIIQLRFAQDSLTPGFVQVPWLNRDGTAYVSDRVILADDGFRDVLISRSPAGLMLCTRLGPEPGARLREATANGIGRKLAVLIEGRVVSVAAIAAPIGDSSLALLIGVYLGPGSNAEAADQLAARILAKWPPSASSGLSCSATPVPS